MITWNEAFTTFTQHQICLISEALWTTTAKGVRARVVDPAHCAMADVLLHGADLGGDAGVDLDWVKDASKWNPKGIKRHPDRDALVAYNEECEEIHRTLEPATIRWPKYPKIGLETRARVSSSWFKRSTKALGRVSDQVKLSLDGGLVTLSAGTDRHAMRTKHEPRKSSGGGEALYSIDYLDNFARHLPPCIITLAWDTDMPLAINYKYRGLSAKLLLSPRIEST